VKKATPKLLRDIVIILAIFLVISAIFSGFDFGIQQIPEVTISELVKQINEGQVSKIMVNGQKLEITLKDESQEKSRKETEASLSESLGNYGVDTEKLAAINIEIKEPSGLAVIATTILPFLLPLLLIGVFFWFMFRQAQKGTSQAFSFIRSQARVASFKEKVTFNDVAGLEEAKEEFKEIVEFLKNPRKFLNMGARIPRGVLMVGAPGTGKTLLARAVAGEANVPFFHMSGSEFVEMFVGVGASRVRDLFSNAKRNAPSIIFIDEIDAVGRHRGAGLGGGHDEREQTLNQILVEMDGFDRETNVMILAATNRPDILDPALLRPGRFDRRIVLDMPDIKEREQILKIHSKGKPLAKTVDLKKIAERTPGFSGADLANVINEGAILAARQNKKEVDQLDLIQSIEKVLLGPERKSHILSTKEKEIAAYHEAGHAIVAANLPHADPVHKVSIVSRGRAAGFTLKLPTEDKHLHSRSEFLADLAVMMGGYAAEKIVFNELTTGASNDIERATDLARDLVTRFGMSEKVGPVAFGRKEELVFLGKEMAEQKNYSEEIASMIDREVKSLIDNAHKTAIKIIRASRKKLNKIAKVLIEKETIEQDEFAKLMARA
jgi:cell division protease FtsH